MVTGILGGGTTQSIPSIPNDLGKWNNTSPTWSFLKIRGPISLTFHHHLGVPSVVWGRYNLTRNDEFWVLFILISNLSFKNKPPAEIVTLLNSVLPNFPKARAVDEYCQKQLFSSWFDVFFLFGSATYYCPYHPCMVYLPTWMVDVYGFHVGKYTSPMDGMGNSHICLPKTSRSTNLPCQTRLLRDPRGFGSNNLGEESHDTKIQNNKQWLLKWFP